MRRNIAGVMMTVAGFALPSVLGGCAMTRHRATVGPGGEIHTLIHCQTRRPDKCTARAQEVCGRYTIIEPVHPSPENENESRMIVHCAPPGASAEAAQPSANSAPSSGGSAATVANDAGI